MEIEGGTELESKECRERTPLFEWPVVPFDLDFAPSARGVSLPPGTSCRSWLPFRELPLIHSEVCLADHRHRYFEQ